MDPYRVGILGATGLVGQRLIRCLEGHPWFEVARLAASDRSLGRPYARAARWMLSADPPAEIASRIVERCELETFADCDLVLSGLDASVARELEPRFAAAGLAVISNSSAFRMDPEVPLLIPEVNGRRLEAVQRQRERNGGGFIVTNPNCSTTGLAVAVAPLHRSFGVRRLVVSTLQALSGAGMDGPRALQFTDNVVPHIPGEEEKLEEELGKILDDPTVIVSAHCHRVGTVDGHLEAVSLELRDPATPEDVVRVLREFEGEVRDLGLPGAPERVIEVRDEPDRPQPRLDRETGGGMTVVVGRVRPCPALGIKLELLAHNTVRGAAGGTVLNAELLAARQLLPRRARA